MNEAKERIMVVGAHPDDVDFASSGTMTKWSREGKEIYYVICTNGDKGGSSNELSPESLVETRRREQWAAGRIAGVKDIIFLGYGDGELEPNKKLKEDLVRVIRKIRPQKVFSFDPANRDFDGFYLYHSDHRAVSISVFDAIYPAAKNRLYFPHLLSEGLAPHKVNELYLYGTKKPNTWIDISEVIEEKIRCIRSHKSQFTGDRAGTVEEYVRANCREAASSRDFQYAESFRAISFPF